MTPKITVLLCTVRDDQGYQDHPEWHTIGKVVEDLSRQTFQDFDIILSHDESLRGAPWARNRGAAMAHSPFLLFSDDDIQWGSNALEVLYQCLTAHPEAAYAYGSYAIGDWVQCDQVFDPVRLRKTNFISTMSLIRREAFSGFDENLHRLQDWDLWLTMLECGHVGVYCGHLLFRTIKGNGITYGANAQPYDIAKSAVRSKHNL